MAERRGEGIRQRNEARTRGRNPDMDLGEGIRRRNQGEERGGGIRCRIQEEELEEKLGQRLRKRHEGRSGREALGKGTRTSI